MRSPAERYTKFKSKKTHDLIPEFKETLNIQPDDFQESAISSINIGDSVLVAAPTGAGKTLIAEFGIFRCLKLRKKLFYTTPIKALSNQKYRDFCDEFGTEYVGLLTGDRKINPDADIVVMTTEILRNMLYSDISRVQDVGTVVMDEVHYLSDRSRGSVWEESLVLLPEGIQVICLSATVSNAEEFGSWLRSIRGNLKVVLSENRPVPLEQLVFNEHKLFPLFVDLHNSGQMRINPVLNQSRPRKTHSGSRSRFTSLDERYRFQLLTHLLQSNRLPVISFIFSRKQCDSAAASLLKQKMNLTSKNEILEIDRYLQDRIHHLNLEELSSLNFEQYRELAINGIATHHAGMIPLFKEIIEELFQLGLIKVVFATETLSLGINMPARTVIIESLRKFNGFTHVDVTPGEYTQLTGRAGRRGIDEIGFAVVPLTEFVSAQSVASLASTRTYPLKSSFQPSYNMTINLLQNFGFEKSLLVLNKSFAQYQRERSLDRNRSKLRELDNQISVIRSGHNQKDLDIAVDYCSAEFQEREIKNRQVISGFRNLGQLDELQSGCIMIFPDDKNNLKVLIDIDHGKQRISYVSSFGFEKRQMDSFTGLPITIGSVKIPRGFNPRDRIARRNLLKQANQALSGVNIGNLVDSHLQQKTSLNDHGFYRLANRERIYRDAIKLIQLEKDSLAIKTKIDQRMDNLGKIFKSISSILVEMMYLNTQLVPTEKGKWLSGIFSEADLLICESIESNLLDDLDLAELASILSIFLYESRYVDQIDRVLVPTDKVRSRLMRISNIYEDIKSLEKGSALDICRNLDGGFTIPIYDWVLGVNIESILTDNEMSPGDFVRWVKQVMDLCNQLSAIDTPIKLKQQLIALKQALNYGIVSAAETELTDSK